MDVKSYEDLLGQIEEYNSTISHLTDLKNELDASDLTDEEKRNQQTELDNNLETARKRLAELLSYQENFNKMYNNIMEMRGIDVNNAQDPEVAQRRLDELRTETAGIRNFLPSNLQEEVRERVMGNISNSQSTQTPPGQEQTSTPNTPNTVNTDEFQRIESEFNGVLGNKSIDELSISEIQELQEKYSSIKERLENLKGSANPSTSIESINSLEEKIDSGLNEAQIIIEERNAVIQRIDEEIKSTEEQIRLAREQVVGFEDQINQLEGNPLNQNRIASLRESATTIQSQITESENKITKLNASKIKITNGEIVDLNKVNPKTTISTGSAPAPESSTGPLRPAPAPSPTGPYSASGPTTPTGPAPAPRRPGPVRPVPAAPTPAVVLPNTLENLVKKGVLPKNLSNSKLLDICQALHISVTDMTTELNAEQIGRLKNDHQIQTALTNQSLTDKNKAMIAKYDALIAQYETILKDKMSNGFSPETIASVEEKLNSAKSERDKLHSQNKEISAFDRSTLMSGIAGLRDDSLDARALDKNDELRKKYKKLDEQMEKKKELKSELFKKIQDHRIKRTLNKIEELKEKKGNIARKQIQVVNEESDKYFDRTGKKLRKQIERQKRTSQSIDKMNEMRKQIRSNNVERGNIDSDLELGNNSFADRARLNLEDMRLGFQNNRLENQINREDRSVRRG